MSYTDDEVESGTEYFYRVTAVDEDGNESGPSNEVSATPGDEDLEPSFGTTIIVHGSNLRSTSDGFDIEDDGLLGQNSDQGWVETMSAAIKDKVGGGIFLLKDGEILQVESGDPDKEKILMFDWLEESLHPVFGYSEAAGDALTAILLEGARKEKWDLSQLHFIAHSRGTIVSSEAIQRLGRLEETGDAPTSVQIDDQIHFTTIDPHPWDNRPSDIETIPDAASAILDAHDHDVNASSNDLLDEEAVVCWENVAYADNYWQQLSASEAGNNFNLTGRSELPGCDFNRSLGDATLPFEGVDIHHGTMPTWYRLSVEGEKPEDEELGGYDHARSVSDRDPSAISASSSIQPKGDETRGHLSVFNGGLGKANEAPIEPISVLANSILALSAPWADPLADAISELTYDRPGISPGWSFHGGTGDGLIGNPCEVSSQLSGCLYNPLNPGVLLEKGAASRRHNIEYVPSSAESIHFTTFAFESSNDDQLKIYFHDLEDGKQEIASLDLSESNRLSSTKRSAPIPGSIQGTSGFFEFAIEPGDGTIDSVVKFDDVGFEKSRQYHASVSPSSGGSNGVTSGSGLSKGHPSGASVYLGAYDTEGNYTGPTSDTTWVAEIPGSKFLVEGSTVTEGRHALILPELPEGKEYTFDLVSKGETEAVDFLLEDRATPGETGAAVFENIDVGPETVAKSTIQSSTSQPTLEVDEDGDGTFETTKEPSAADGTLPVELASFSAYAQDGSTARLTWQTASEQNNAGFEVQHRPSDTKGWRTLGFVDSKASGGTTSETNTYRYAAEDLSVGMHRFRLKQEDLDGSATLTDPVTVQLRMQEALKLMSPSPNPVSETATLSFAVKEETKATVAVYNTLGQRVKTLYNSAPTAGENQRLRLDASSLPSGTYFIRLEAAGKTRTQRLTVVR